MNARPTPVVELFVGPTAHDLPASLLDQPGVRRHPPARRGHIAHLIECGPPGHIALVDGRFDDVPAVGHREILAALEAGWQVTGLGSIGALRAAELHEHGMAGYGRVFAHLVATGAPDDEVALLHGPAPAYLPLTEALVDLRAFTAYLTATDALRPAQATAVIGALAHRWFGDRSLPAFLDAVRTIAGPTAAATARIYLPSLPDIRLKTADLRAYLMERPWACP
ncbi:TfuA-like protein [Streptomyces rimosus]|uniref:TfuA-like protein n=1 Tax=Streptomyces rimosus TaxID=1927 RepID=UPI00067C8A04|nr:TfuA-like protein [Streptomyces rimosus]